METLVITTPFGRRPMAVAMMKRQFQSQQASHLAVDKWKIYRALCEAKPRLAVTDRALAVLNALLSFYPKTELSSKDILVVFPSNEQLSLRAHGMAEQTIRRHLAVLVEAGLILRKDSPNGKRFARKDRQGKISDAYGFSLAPLLARSTEIEALADEVQSERLILQQKREQISLCRRDIAKLIDAALKADLSGPWEQHYIRFRQVVDSVPRSPTFNDLEHALTDLNKIHVEITNQLKTQLNTPEPSANTLHIERHIKKTNPESQFESIPQLNVSGREQNPIPTQDSAQSLSSADTAKSISIDQILHACPEIIAYGPGGQIRGWSDLIHASTITHRMLGIGHPALASAHQSMGIQLTAVVLAYLLEKASDVENPGGYLRTLTRHHQEGRLKIHDMLQRLSGKRVKLAALSETKCQIASLK